MFVACLILTLLIERLPFPLIIVLAQFIHHQVFGHVYKLLGSDLQRIIRLKRRTSGELLSRGWLEWILDYNFSCVCFSAFESVGVFSSDDIRIHKLLCHLIIVLRKLWFKIYWFTNCVVSLYVLSNLDRQLNRLWSLHIFFCFTSKNIASFGSFTYFLFLLYSS